MQSEINFQGKVLRVENQLLADILTTAVEGGIQYWCEVIRYNTGENPSHNSATIVESVDGEVSEPYQVDIDTVRLGMERMLNQTPANTSTSTMVAATYYQLWTWLKDSVEDNDATMVDADVADAVLQFALFDEMRYG